MRKVQIYKSKMDGDGFPIKKDGKPVKEVDQVGFFHKFDRSVEFIDGMPVPFPAAIVEKDDGHVVAITVNMIKFIDRPEGS